MQKAQFFLIFFLHYCEGTKAYMLMYLQIKMIIKNRDVIFIEDGMSVGETLEMRPSERNEGLTVVVVHEFSK